MKWSWRAVFDDDGRDDNWPWILWENYHLLLLLLLISFYLTFFFNLSVSLSLCACLISWWQLWSCCSSIIIIINNNNNSNYVTFSIYIQPKTDHVLVVLYSAYDERRGHRTLMYNCEHRREIIYFVVFCVSFFRFGPRSLMVSNVKAQNSYTSQRWNVDGWYILYRPADNCWVGCRWRRRRSSKGWESIAVEAPRDLHHEYNNNKKYLKQKTSTLHNTYNVPSRYTRYVSTHHSTVTYTRPRPLSSALDSTLLEKRLFPYNCWWIQNWWWTSNFKTKPKKLRIITSPLIFIWDLLDFVLCMEQRRERP